MKNTNLIFILSIVILVISFLLGVSIGSIHEDNINVSAYTKDKSEYAK